MLKLIIILLSLGHTNLWAKTYSLDDLKKIMVQNHNSMKISKQKVLQTEAKVTQAKSNFMPKLGIQLIQDQINSEHRSDVELIKSVYGQINLFNGFKDRAFIDTQNNLHKISNIERRQVEFNLKKELEKNYYNFLYLEEKKKIISTHIERANSHIKLVSKRYRAGIVTETDIIEFKLHLNKLKNQLNYLTLEQKQILTIIRFFVFQDNKQEVELSGRLPHLIIQGSVNELEKLIEKSPNLIKNKILYSNSDALKTSAKSTWYPQIDLRVEHGFLDEVETGVDNSQESTRMILSANWEFFSGFNTQASESVSEGNKLQYEYEIKQTLFNLNLQVNTLFQKMKMLEVSITNEEENEKIAKQLYTKTIAQYQKGVKDTGALANASSQLNDIQSRIYQYKANYILAKIQLEISLGSELVFKKLDH